MTIKEFKEILDQYPDNARIFIPRHTKGAYTTVAINYDYSDYEGRVDGSSGLLYIHTPDF